MNVIINKARDEIITKLKTIINFALHLQRFCKGATIKIAGGGGAVSIQIFFYFNHLHYFFQAGDE